MSTKETTLEQSLQAYRVMNTPTQYSWKQHWAQEEFDSPDMMDLDPIDRRQYFKRLEECNISILPNKTAREGVKCTLKNLVETLIDPNNKKVIKDQRKVVYSASNGVRPIGEDAFNMWNGFQVIDMDIKNEVTAKKLKSHIFSKLNRCNWFLGVALSSSGMGLHVYTKIAIPESNEDDIRKRKLLYFTNFRHKYSFVYIACLSAMNELGFTKDDLVKWMDLMMFKPQQGAFIGYDPHPLINTRFFEDFIYVNFDNVESMGSPDIDWIAHPDLKALFKRWEWFEEEDGRQLNVEVLEKPELEFDTHNKVHYKHFERWRLANTLVKLYGKDQGYKYLRMICANTVKDKELQADCVTAARHEKPVDPWAVNRLNTIHGFKIKLNIQDDSFDEAAIFSSMDKIDNPTIIKASKDMKNYHLTKDQYLGNIRWQLLEDVGRVTLLEAGAGVGKTEMVKQLVRDGKKIVMVMPFTSTIKAKVENDKDWYYSYANRKVRLDVAPGLAMTVDKFSHLNLMDIKVAGYDYIFIDESHLLFMSEYRPVMAKIVEMIRNTEVPIILMSGTPSGELVFFQDIRHLRVVKDDTRQKEFRVNLVDSTPHLMYHMCKAMARDIKKGKRILFPTNAGTLYSEQIKAGVTYFLQTEYGECFTEKSYVNLKYYKKSNVGEEFMDAINFEKSIKDVQILMCSTYLSVGVDILDRFDFSIYFADLFMPQEVEQWANRLRSNDLYINLYVAKNDAEGNSRSLHKYKEINFKLNDEEIKNVHSILRLCNEMIERNPVEYKYNSLISSIIHDNKFIEHNEIENRYYLNEIAYTVTCFERKYRDYVEQLPVLMKGMQAYGYQISSQDLGEFQVEGTEIFRDVKGLMRQAYDDRVALNTTHIEELMELITEDRLDLYKQVLAGKYDIRKGDEWRDDLTNHRMLVKNIEVFEKVIPIFVSLTKQYKVDQIREIFEFCRHKGGAFNFAAIKRIRTLVNILYNDKNQRLDLPIKEFMKESYEFSDYKKVRKKELDDFISNFAKRYAMKASTHSIIINKSIETMKELEEKFMTIFKCLVNISRATRDGVITMERVELLWKERTIEENDFQTQIYAIDEFLGVARAEIQTIDVEVEKDEVNF
jgi:hypothetical protein